MTGYINYKKLVVTNGEFPPEPVEGEKYLKYMAKYGIEKWSDVKLTNLIDIAEYEENILCFLLPGNYRMDKLTFKCKKLILVGFINENKTTVDVLNWNLFQTNYVEIKNIYFNIAETGDVISSHYGSFIFNNGDVKIKNIEVLGTNNKYINFSFVNLDNIKIMHSKITDCLLEFSYNKNLKLFDNIIFNNKIYLRNGSGNILSNYFDQYTKLFLWNNHMCFIKNVFNLADDYFCHIDKESDCCFAINKFKGTVKKIFKITNKSDLILTANNFTDYNIKEIFASITNDCQIISNQCYIINDNKKINVDADTLNIYLM